MKKVYLVNGMIEDFTDGTAELEQIGNFSSYPTEFMIQGVVDRKKSKLSDNQRLLFVEIKERIYV